MDFEGEAFDVCEDFEKEFADELEMMGIMETESTAQEERYKGDVPISRRNLSLTSPFQTSANEGGGCSSRKRPIDEENSIHIGGDKRKKIPRLEDSTHPYMHISTNGSAPLKTPTRKGQIPTTKKFSQNVVRREEDEPGVPYSPPSPPSPPHSPTSPPSSPHSPMSQYMNEPSREKSSAVRDQSQRRHNDTSEGHTRLTNHTPSHQTRSTSLTPHKNSTPSKTTPSSTGNYRRTLDPSSIERERDEERATERDSYARMAAKSLMDKFETAYSALKEPLDEEEIDDLPSDLSTQRSKVATSAGSKLNRLYALSRAPSGPHVTVTDSNGTRVYLRMKSSQQPQNKNTSSRFQLLSVPISDLRETVEEERRAKLIRQSDDLLRALQENIEEADGSQVLFDEEGGLVHDNVQPGHMLWVDKYSPHHYTELLSDDGINRTLLSWLRLWDEVVFDRPIPIKSGVANPGGGGAKPGGGGAKPGASGWGKPTPKGNRFEKRTEFQDPATFSGQEALDETRRPRIKLTLLCGAPGLGKTTLAHIIATHAGYNVVEMNASDDRSPDVFRQRIEAATQMQAVLTATTKPNCLIIDEIDGAPIAAINVLIEFVTKKDKSSSKKKSVANTLSRPIICICNDQYTPSLRQLRQHSLLLYFPPIITSRLASRLQQCHTLSVQPPKFNLYPDVLPKRFRHVTKKEQLSANMSTLMALCEKTSNDIRSCLNTVQFLSGTGKDITLGSIQATSIGQKDAQRSLFSLWKDVFQLQSSKKHTLNQGPLKMSTIGSSSHGNASLGTSATRFHNILLAASATGEYEKIANGLFENYLLVKVRDPNLEAVSVAQDWIGFHDHLQQHIAHMQDYLFMAYLPFLSVAFHFLFAASSKAQLKYPNTSYEVFLRSQRSRHLLSSMLLEVTPHVRSTVNPTLLVCEVLPFLSEIIAPSFRPVSTQLYSAREKQQLVDLVGTMIAYSLTYRQERGMDGQYTYVLDPNIEELSKFPGLPQRKQLSYSAKQLISREVEMEKMRRAESISTARNKGPSEGSRKDDKQQTVSSETKDGTRRLPQKKFTPTIKEEKPPVDFFGRVITPSRAKGPGCRRVGGGKSTRTHPLWFKFNEGYSNAVRRPIKIQSLL